MVSNLESLAGRFKQQDILHNTLQALQMEATTRFYAENADLIGIATEKVLNSLDRFRLSGETKERTANDLVFLWTQAKLAEKLAQQSGDNRISGFNVGAAIGVHFPNPQTGTTDFYFSSGANREPDNIAIATHAETSAIEVLRRQLAPLCASENQPFVLDFVVTTRGASPCGSCREEIYTHRSSDQTSVAIFYDNGEVTVKPITGLFPTRFPEITIGDVPLDLLKAARNASKRSRPSPYQKKDSLPNWGVALGLDSNQFEIGFNTGDDAFWSNSATIDAIGRVLRYEADHNLPLPEENQRISWEELEPTSLARIKSVVYYYDGPALKFYPSGKERQQLSILPENTEIYIVVKNGSETKAYKITRGELLPAAFTA